MKKFFENILHYLGFPFVGTTFVFGLLSLLRKSKKYEKDQSSIFQADRYKIVHKLVKKYMYLKNIKFEHDGFQQLTKVPCLYIVNHKSLADVLGLICSFFATGNINYYVFVGKKELNEKKVVLAAMKLIDSIFIDRDDLRKAFDVLQQQNKIVRDGRSIVIFAEGTRVKKHELGEFKGGALHVAYQNCIPIVPISIYGSLGLMDNADDNIQPVGRTLYLSCMKPIKPSEFINASTQNVADRIKEQIEKRYEEMRMLNERKQKVFTKE